MSDTATPQDDTTPAAEQLTAAEQAGQDMWDDYSAEAYGQ